MLKEDIIIGETYLFVGSDSPTRAHLAGSHFTVVRKDRVFRKAVYSGSKKRTRKGLRFFNDDNIGARAEELEPLKAEEIQHDPSCYICGAHVDIEDVCIRCEQLTCDACCAHGNGAGDYIEERRCRRCHE